MPSGTRRLAAVLMVVAVVLANVAFLPHRDQGEAGGIVNPVSA